jgi:hypothetical protein
MPLMNRTARRWILFPLSAFRLQLSSFSSQVSGY